MDVCDARKLPVVGEVYVVPNDATWEPERLTCVLIQEVPDIANMMGVEHAYFVYFASPDEKDNIHELTPGGVKYYCIKTYA